MEQLFSTSLVALILTPRLLRIVNTKVPFPKEQIKHVLRLTDLKRHSTICELTFHGMVVAVKMNRKRLVVILEETVFIYDISNMKMLHSQLTPINPAGICAISPNSESNYLALPHYQKTPPSQQSSSHVPKAIVKETISGDVLLYDLNKMEEVTVIPAHQTPVSCIAINNDGTLMATSSEKGTVIRIFSIPDGKKLFQFRRGSMPARIYSMSFNAASTLLCVSSATETVHVFKLSAPQNNPQHNNNNNNGSSSPPYSPSTAKPGTAPWSRDRSVSPSTSEDQSESANLESSEYPPAKSSTGRRSQPNIMSFVRRTSQNVSTSLVSRAAGYLPSSVTEMWEPQRDFAWVRVPKGSGGQPVKSVVAMGNQAPTVMVATSEGGFLVYSLDLERGGEGTLIRRFE